MKQKHNDPRVFTIYPNFNITEEGSDNTNRSVIVEIDDEEDWDVRRIRGMDGNPCNIRFPKHKRSYSYHVFIPTYGTYEITSRGEIRHLIFSKDEMRLEVP